MKLLIECLCRALSTFGFVAGTITLSYAALIGDSLTHDDSYILGGIVGGVVSLISIPSFLLSEIWNRSAGIVSLVMLYSILASYSIYVMRTAELHGPGIALIILLGSLVAGIIEFFVLRKVRLVVSIPLGFALAITFISALMWIQY